MPSPSPTSHYRLDATWLQSVGLESLPPSTANELLKFVYQRLEMSVGTSLAKCLTNEELDEFEAFLDRDDEAAALVWLEAHVPDYQDTVRRQMELLTLEVRTHAPSFLEALAPTESSNAEEPF